MDPAMRRVLLGVAYALASVAAVGGSYAGVSWYLERPAPASTPASGLAASPTPVPGPARLVVHATGDVNLDPRQLGVARTSFAAPWDGVREVFSSDDLTIVNLECAPSPLGEPQEKRFTFRCDDGHDEMRAAGVEVANLGNNHSLDYGPEALVDGVERLSGAGIAPVGAGRDAAEANAPAVFELKGWKVAVLGFGGVVPTPGWIAGANHPGVSDGYSTESMVTAVRAADEVADLVFVTVHWGAELDTEPRADDVARAHALVDAGADAVFGHHSHRLQPLERYKDRPIAFGLGNFVWPAGGTSAVAQVVVMPGGRVDACLLPVTLGGGRPRFTGATAC